MNHYTSHNQGPLPAVVAIDVLAPQRQVFRPGPTVIDGKGRRRPWPGRGLTTVYNHDNAVLTGIDFERDFDHELVVFCNMAN